jgi:hypothetical protein
LALSWAWYLGIATDAGSGDAVGKAEGDGDGDGDAALLPKSAAWALGCVTANAALIATSIVSRRVKRFNVFEILSL